MDTNDLLRSWGYHNLPNFGEIAKWASQQKLLSDAALKVAVESKFGQPQVAKIEMRDTPAPYNLFLPNNLPVDGNAVDQLKTALRLPVALGGAGMPDMHKGYSLPIGGVVALVDAVSPAFVGYDIACQMRLSILEDGLFKPRDLDDEMVCREFLYWVLASTSFGLGATSERVDHPVMYNDLWNTVPFLRNLKDLAWSQLGSSGAGNHFADIVYGKKGLLSPFIGLMTHSGSRGVGNKVGHHYATLADEQTKAAGYKFPTGYGWLSLRSDLGQEYWEVMTLMGKYAASNHEIVHARFCKASGYGVAKMVKNMHNFAWSYGSAIVHRKGATPANYGTYGIIPGSSGDPSYLVRGKATEKSWYSASHGAGRPFSRSEAKRQHNEASFVGHMRKLGITYHGVAADETFAAYKPIESVMAAQTELVDIEAIMYPKVVVMGGASVDDGD